MSDKFRLAGSTKEFFVDLKNLKKTDHDLLIWQTDESGKKKLVNGKFDNYTLDRDKILIDIVMDKTLAFNQDSDVYILEKVKGILFKGRYDFCVAGKLRLHADEKFYLKEKRANDRFFFNYTEIPIEIKYEKNDKETIQRVILKDVNKNGFGFLCKAKNAGVFQEDMKLSLIKIHSIELPKQINGVVVHKSSFKDTLGHFSGKHVHFGVKFHRANKLIDKVMSAMNAEIKKSRTF